MFRCHVCGRTEFKESTVDEVFHIDERPVLVEEIPAQVCSRCGEAALTRETTERIRRMVHGDAMPVKSVSMEVFAYA